MAYLGQVPQMGNFVKLDDISTQFNGVLNTFATKVSGVAYSVSNPFATQAAGNGAVYNPGVDYYFNGATIVFATPPSGTLVGKFFIMVYGDVLNTGVPSDGTITNSKLTAGTIQYDRLAATTQATLLANSLLFGA